MGADDEFSKLYEQYMKSFESTSIGKFNVNPELANEIVKYIMRQVNEFSKMAKLNREEYSIMLKQAEKGLYILCYVTYYDTNLIDKRPIFISGTNLLRLMYSRVLDGRDREVVLAEIDTRRQVIVGGAR